MCKQSFLILYVVLKLIYIFKKGVRHSFMMKIKNNRILFIATLCAMGSVLFCGSGCVYFNLFYNAESNFNTAYAAHQKLLKANPDSAIILPADIDNGYKKTIEKCNKVFEVYPKDKKWHVKTFFLMGKAYCYDGDYDKAIHVLQQVLQRYPESPLCAEAMSFIGKSYLKKEDLDKAEEILSSAMVKYPALNKNQELDLLLADIAIKREGKSAAIDILEKTYSSLKSVDKKLELIVKIAQIYKDMKLYDKAIIKLDGAPRSYEYPQQMYRIDFLKVSCFVAKGNLDRSLDILVKMLSSKIYVSHIPQMLMIKGEIIEKKGDVDGAMAIYKQIIDIYATSDFVGNAWFGQGRLYQVKKNDLVKAKECYDKAGSLAKDPAIKDLALLRSKAIDFILKSHGASVPDTAKGDSITTTKYKVGELFWLDLDQPDSAFRYYCRAIGDTMHKAMIPKALYAAAWIARYALSDSLKADSLYSLLVKHYPTNEFSRKAQLAKGDTLLVMTNRDSAQEAFHTAEKLYWDAKLPDSAAEAYLGVATQFPKTEFAPKSLYAAAWINDFVLDKNKTAKNIYEQLCDSFPTSSYCAEARVRLKTVADTFAAWRALKKLPPKSDASHGNKTTKIEAGTVADSIKSKQQSVLPDLDTASAVKAATKPGTPAPGPAAPQLPIAGSQTTVPPPYYRRGMRMPPDSNASRSVPATKPDSILPNPVPKVPGEVIGQ